MFLSVSGSNAQLVSKGSFKDTVPRAVTGYDIQGWLLEVEAGVNPAPDFEFVEDILQLGNQALRIVVHALGLNACFI
jgi:hypothetical protein